MGGRMGGGGCGGGVEEAGRLTQGYKKIKSNG